jgi:hypothetical protein
MAMAECGLNRSQSEIRNPQPSIQTGRTAAGQRADKAEELKRASTSD